MALEPLTRPTSLVLGNWRLALSTDSHPVAPQLAKESITGPLCDSNISQPGHTVDNDIVDTFVGTMVVVPAPVARGDSEQIEDIVERVRRRCTRCEFIELELAADLRKEWAGKCAKHKQQQTTGFSRGKKRRLKGSRKRSICLHGMDFGSLTREG